MTRKDRKSGILLRADNGKLIEFDETGLPVELADGFFKEAERRLKKKFERLPVDAGVLGDINAWDVHECDGWYLFQADLPGAQRGGCFRRRVQPSGDQNPDIIAEPSTALFGLFSIGGARRSSSFDLPVNYPFHVLGPGDDMGAVGSAGTVLVEKNEVLSNLKEHTRDSLVADEIVRRRMNAYRALPVFCVRSETDSSASTEALLGGPAMKNFEQTVSNFCSAARSLSKSPKCLAVGLEFSFDAVEDEAAEWLDGTFKIMEAITNVFLNHKLHKPLFVSSFDAGTDYLSDGLILRAQGELTWQKAGHDHVFPLPPICSN